METSTPKSKKERYERVQNRQRHKSVQEVELIASREAAHTLLDLSSAWNTDVSLQSDCDADTENSPPSKMQGMQD